jgi:hypothetical protein
LITLDGVSEYLKQVPRILDIYQSINAHQRFRQDFSEHESSTVTLYLPLESSPCLPDNIYIYGTLPITFQSVRALLHAFVGHQQHHMAENII